MSKSSIVNEDADVELNGLLSQQIQNNIKEGEDEGETIRSLKDDRFSIMLLVFLYLLQGIPIGFSVSIPLILQQRKISYKEQSLFSFITWPFSLKLLWAPILDSVYWGRIGRRKSWLIPVQYIIGLTMIFLSNHISSLLGDKDSEPKLLRLFFGILFLYFLAATQDIVVDGWAISMLSRKNIGHASSCNTIGVTAGVFIGKVLFLALESADFCNSYLRSEPKDQGIVTISSFLKFWGYVFCITTTGILIFKNENKYESETFLGVKETYKVLYHILCLPSMKLVVAIYMSWHVCFALTDHVIDLKLVESGLPKEHLALLDVPIFPVIMFIPLFIKKHLVGSQPLNFVIKLYPYKLFFGIVFAVLLWWTRSIKTEIRGFPVHFYATLLAFYLIYRVIQVALWTTCVAFHTKVSDPFIGGTYMTLLNTVFNFGCRWPTVALLWWMDPLTYTECQKFNMFTCDSKEHSKKCIQAGGSCVTTIDGYYILTIFCVTLGYIWFKWGKPALTRLQQMPPTAWTY